MDELIPLDDLIATLPGNSAGYRLDDVTKRQILACVLRRLDRKLIAKAFDVHIQTVYNLTSKSPHVYANIKAEVQGDPQSFVTKWLTRDVVERLDAARNAAPKSRPGQSSNKRVAFNPNAKSKEGNQRDSSNRLYVIFAETDPDPSAREPAWYASLEHEYGDMAKALGPFATSMDAYMYIKTDNRGYFLTTRRAIEALDAGEPVPAWATADKLNALRI